ncbi:VOC family protein [Nocardia sp. NBC_01377]|uniref:VOC family protein n=1 Tax=Nocardia sp. NBC_01377 TaxID=2903595 RepID=UPI003254DDE4
MTTHDLCWIDLGVIDTDRAADFYQQLLGWSIDDPDDTGYRIASLHDEPIAALGRAEDDGAPYWTIYVTTLDIHAITRTAQSAGATILVPPTVAGEAGIGAVARSPQGIPFSMWQPRQHRGTRIDAHLFVDDTQGSRAFLHAVLDWRLRTDGTITTNGQSIATWSPVATPVRPSPWLIRFPVADPTTTREHAERLGATPDTDVIGALTDPCGARFTLTQQANTSCATSQGATHQQTGVRGPSNNPRE